MHAVAVKFQYSEEQYKGFQSVSAGKKEKINVGSL